MLSINEAVKIAQKSLQDLIPQASNILLEEAEISDDKQWLITLSFPGNDDQETFIAGYSPRKYKTFAIDAESGVFKAMRMRHV